MIDLIVGLGNPGSQYETTRHNAGFWFLDRLAQEHGQRFRPDNKFHGEVCRITLAGQAIWLLKPMLFMNRSGQATAALANFYKIKAESILVVHDELDLPPGTVRLKQNGGHGGHNGLRDITSQLGSKEFKRLRIAIGHPGTGCDVSGYVLNRAPKDEQQEIDNAIDAALGALSQIVSGDDEKAMNQLHSR